MLLLQLSKLVHSHSCRSDLVVFAGECGVPAHECVVKRPGPNLGRQFWACGAWSLLKGRGCQYFCWADEPPGGVQSPSAQPDPVASPFASLF